MENSSPTEINDKDIASLVKELNLSRKKPVPVPPSYETVITTGREYPNLRVRLLYLWLYLTGQRISEALRVKRRDVTRRQIGALEYWLVDSITLKNRLQPRREISVPMHGIEEEKSRAVYATIEPLDPDELIFEGITRQKAYNYLSTVKLPCQVINAKKERFLEEIPVYPHLLRHCRATHLVREHNFHLKMLMDFFGWSSPTMANVYTSPSWQSTARGFIH